MNVYQKNTATLLILITALLGSGYFVFTNKREAQKPLLQQAQNLSLPSATTAQDANWQLYRDAKFELSIPPQWQKAPGGTGTLISADNKYFLNFFAIGLDQYEVSSTMKSLYATGKLLEAEQMRIEAQCIQADVCGEMKEVNSIPVSGGIGIEFIIRYQGLGVDEPDKGFSNEIHRTILKEGILYSFWTSESVAPEELKNKYPILDPSPIQIFKNILDTFETV